MTAPPDWRPVPDPTELTTAAVELATAQYRRELATLREIIETRLDGGDKAVEVAAAEIAKLREQGQAAQRLLADDTSGRLSAEREFLLGQIAIAAGETRRVGDVAQEKFAAIEGTFASNALALTAALAAQKEAAAEQNKSNTLAISKSEQATKETILANAAQTVAGLGSQAATIADLKDRVVRLESGGAATATARDQQRLDTGQRITGWQLMVAALILGVALYAALHK